MDYKNKYLKYKNKYLELKNKLSGGKIYCPSIGFHQHSGECWNDSTSMILLFSDIIGEKIQLLFNLKPMEFEEQFKLNMEYSIKSLPEFMAPYNIERSFFNNYDYKSKVKKYFITLYERYRNNRDFMKSVISQKQISTSLSYVCVEKLIDIFNYNNISRSTSDSGGSIENVLLNLNLINFYLLNYRNPIRDKFNVLTTRVIKIDKINYEDIDKLYELIDTTLCVYIALDSDINSDINSDIGHAQGFFSCDNTQFFYDNNGVSDDNNNTHQEFNWKEYLKTKLISIKKELETKLKIDNTYCKDLYSLVGRNYLRSDKYYPTTFSLIFYETLTQEEYETKNTFNLPYLGRFTNKRTIDLILNYIKLNPKTIITKQIIEDVISNFNYVLLDLILKLNESENLGIDYEKINLVFNIIYLTMNKKEKDDIFDKNLIDVLINNNINFNVLVNNNLILNVLLDFFTDNTLDIYEYILQSNKININKDERFSSPVLFNTIQNINSENIQFFMKIIKLLLKYGADPNISHGKVNLIIYCTRKNLYEVLSLLLENGGNVNIQENISKNTPYNIAKKDKNERIIELLLKHGAHGAHGSHGAHRAME